MNHGGHREHNAKPKPVVSPTRFHDLALRMFWSAVAPTPL